MLTLGTSQYSAAQPAKLTLLKNVDVVTSAEGSRIELRFNGTPHENGIIYGEGFLQVEFPDTYISPPKQRINVEDNIVKDIFVYQFDESTVRARIFTLGKAENLKDKIRLSREDNKIIILYNQEPVTTENKQQIANSKQITTNVEQARGQRSEIRGQKAEARRQKPEVRSQISEVRGKNQEPIIKKQEYIEPVSVVTLPVPDNLGQGARDHEQSSEPATPPSVTVPQSTPKEKTLIPAGVESPDIYASLFKMILALGIILSLLFIALFLFKKFIGRKMGITGQDQSIRVIASAYIGPKKSIALVDISGERIVVGITPNHISMLTRLGKDGEFRDILKEQISSNDKVELRDELWEKV